MGGTGRNGGGGGRLAVFLNKNFYIGDYLSTGGIGNGGEYGAAGTVYIRDMSSDGAKTLRVYNQQGTGVNIYFLIFRSPELLVTYSDHVLSVHRLLTFPILHLL